MKIRTEAKRVAIIEAATELFKEFGYERASMNELAKRLGGSKATLYGYFPSKQLLFGAVVRTIATSHLGEATAKLQRSGQAIETLETTLFRFAEQMLQVTTNDTQALAVYRMVIAEAGHSEVGQLFYESGPSECLNVLTNVMAQAIDGGYLRKADPRILANQFLALVTAEVGMRTYQQNPTPLAPSVIHQIACRAVEMFFAGASPRGQK